ncbi:hypothetical protein [Marinibactrum halimedae]|uniref:Uncharacterized protein n=1 Tax=Marinibactrum halimedae TaxID=1444977 RepID=A0AA37T288_9GAMM|nr:hypothetical protein [Marinibactrum halimedae]MCD9458065.1 hypothetical protein [Marinibactrum halimedae]GLS24998.1 hypothetical protein GCM10007877_07120 [Marinibactrum halimedae]
MLGNLTAHQAIEKIVENIFNDGEPLCQTRIAQQLKYHEEIVERELSRIGGYDHYIVSFWQPLMGWLCGLALCYATVLFDVIGLVGYFLPSLPIQIPPLSLSLVIEMLISILGIGWFHTLYGCGRKLQRVFR